MDRISIDMPRLAVAVLLVVVAIVGAQCSSSSSPDRADDAGARDSATLDASPSDAATTSPGDAGDASTALPDHPKTDVPDPVLSVSDLEMRWQAQFIAPGTTCTWNTYDISIADASSPQPIADALQDARATAACGPVLTLAPGTYDIGQLVIDKPTIIIGAAGVVLRGSLLGTKGAPLWIQDLEIADAPAPGAILMSHPSAETTMVRIKLTSPEGFGVLHNGGVLSMWSSSVTGAHAPQPDAGISPTFSRLFMQGAATTGKLPYTPAPRLSFITAEMAAPELFGPTAPTAIGGKLMALASPGYAWSPIDFSVLPPAGVGVYTHAALVEIDQSTFTSNASAGVVLDQSIFYGNELTVVLNGTSPSVVAPDIGSAYASPTLFFGGLLVRNHTIAVVDTIEATANAPVGIAVTGAASFGGISAHLDDNIAGPWAADSTSAGDGIATVDAWAGIKLFLAGSNSRSGILFSNSSGNCTHSATYENSVGTVLFMSKVYLANDSNDGNDENMNVNDGDLPVPNDPLPFPGG